MIYEVRDSLSFEVSGWKNRFIFNTAGKNNLPAYFQLHQNQGNPHFLSKRMPAIAEKLCCGVEQGGAEAVWHMGT